MQASKFLLCECFMKGEKEQTWKRGRASYQPSKNSHFLLSPTHGEIDFLDKRHGISAVINFER